MNICVYGASSNNIEESFFKYGELIGQGIARRGWTMVFGGGANGMMGAAARGVFSEGGKLVGVSPNLFRVDGVLFENCTQLIFTEDMRERKKIMEEKSDGFLVLPGGVGTFDEFFEVLVLRQLGYHAKPIGLLNVNACFEPLLSLLYESQKTGFVSKETVDMILVSDDPETLLTMISDNRNGKRGIFKALK